LIGLRKFIHGIVFSFLVLVFLTAIKFAGKDLNKWEFFTLAVIILGFPLTNTLAKIVSRTALSRIEKLTERITSLIQGVRDGED